MFNNDYRITSCNCDNRAEVNENGKIILGFTPHPRFCPVCGNAFRVELISDFEREELKSKIDKLTIEVETLRKYRKQGIHGLEKEYRAKRDDLANKNRRYELIN